MKLIRLTNKEIEQIKQLTKKGKSLNKIREILGKGKTTVYYHFRKFKGDTIKPIKINCLREELWGEFIGLVAGDGCLSKTKDYQYRVYLFFSHTEHEYVTELYALFSNFFSKPPMKFDRGDMFTLCYYSKELYSSIKQYLKWNTNGRKSHSVHLAEKEYTKQFKTGFLRGSIDSDGYLSDKKINFATSSPYLAENIMQFLKELQIDYHYFIYKEKRENRRDMHHINIGKNNRKKFLELIKPRNIKGLCVGRDLNFRTPALSVSRIGGLEGRSHSH